VWGALRSTPELKFVVGASGLRVLNPLGNLKWLTHFNIRQYLISEISDLKPLENLKELTHLTLDISESKVIDLTPLETLPRIQEVSIFNSTKAQRLSLRKIHSSLVHLAF
jgi:hypothetical protein